MSSKPEKHAEHWVWGGEEGCKCQNMYVKTQKNKY